METKTFTALLEIKSDDSLGNFKAVFATLNIPDLDMDVTLPGAFGEQRVLLESWNHNYQSPPVGKGRIFEDGDDAIVDGGFFLDTNAGKEHYIIAKELQDIQEFSYTFQILDSEQGKYEGKDVRFLKRLDVVGVSQVSRGAGINTRVLDIKNAENVDEDEDEASDEGKSSVDTLAKIDLIELTVIKTGMEA